MRFGLRSFHSVTARLILGYSLLALASMAVLSLTIYFDITGSLSAESSVATRHLFARLDHTYRAQGGRALAATIDQLLQDGIDTDREIYLYAAPDHTLLAGNLTAYPAAVGMNRMQRALVQRNGQPSHALILATRYPDGAVLMVGWDLSNQTDMRRMLTQAMIAGSGVALLLSFLGAGIFRRLISAPIIAIRQTANQIGPGRLDRRLPPSRDEFAKLNDDINAMLDRIQSLVDGVRTVSNAVAHDLRTPLGRMRARLEAALQQPGDAKALAAAAGQTIADIDGLIQIFDKLLTIAQAETGAPRSQFIALDLNRLAHDLFEFYDLAAEDQGIALHLDPCPQAPVLGDRQLLMMAGINLLENALKYTPAGGAIHLETRLEETRAALIVSDNGPGIPPALFDAVRRPFIRLDPARQTPGNGLGLAIVSAMAQLHDGELRLEDNGPGLKASLLLPSA